MGKKIEHIHWPDAPNVWMPYAPAIKVTGGSLVFLAGVTAAPVYHSHPHIPEEFASMPEDMEGIPSFIIEKLLKDLSMECLVPESVYKKGMEDVGEYVGENMSKICKGPLFDMAEKFGVELED